MFQKAGKYEPPFTRLGLVALGMVYEFSLGGVRSVF
jgi:hypothetical protein